MESKNFLAVDLGAESGRGIIAAFDGAKLTLTEINRFPTYNTSISGHTYWDALAIFSEIKKTIAKACAQEGKIDGIGITTWGVDYGLIGQNDLPLANPFHYRDKRTNGIMEKVFEIVPRREIFSKTGIQFMQLNTLFQLYATLKEFPFLLEQAKTMLLMPDLFTFWLTGHKSAEYTISTTSQLYDSLASGQPQAPRGNWMFETLEKIGIPIKILPEVISPGTRIGTLDSALRQELNVPDIPVFKVCSHDTASAVVSIPAKGGNWAYLSSGTWSLLGIEIPDPIINDASFKYNFTNEGGYEGSIRFLKNIMGLWILQECVRLWSSKGTTYSYEDLSCLAEEAEPFFAFIDVDEPDFLFPGNMPEKIAAYCEKTGQKIPQTEGQITRVILESLAMEYRFAIQILEEIIDQRIEVIHIVGGGSRNKLLSQFTASSTRKVVITGPVEATTIGNVLVQALSQNEISDISEIRSVVRNSFPMIAYQPKDTSAWEEKYGFYKTLKERK